MKDKDRQEWNEDENAVVHLAKDLFNLSAGFKNPLFNLLGDEVYSLLSIDRPEGKSPKAPVNTTDSSKQKQNSKNKKKDPAAFSSSYALSFLSFS